MKIFISDTYESMSRQAADDIVEMMQSRTQPLICTASGDSPAGLYKKLVEKVHDRQLDISEWQFVGLDEWVGLNGHDEGSCRYHLNLQLFHPLAVADEKICFFNGRAADLEAECDQTENYIHKHGGMDVAVLGVGMNGHVGMNEPGTSASMRSHVIELHPTTRQVGQKYFRSEQKLTQGITLGIASLMEARNLVVLISGTRKADITQKIIEEDISENLPATLLRRHPSLRIYLDKEAASKIIGG